MNPRLIDTFGPRFLVDDVRDLELLTDILATSKDHLNVVFAVASYLEQVPSGGTRFKPLLRERVRESVHQLLSRSSAELSLPSASSQHQPRKE